MNIVNINIVAFKTIVSREVGRVFRIWPQTLLPSVINSLLYFTIFGTLIGSRIGTMDEHSYLSFLAPGLIMMAIINNCYTNVSSSFFSAKYQKHIDEILIAPVSEHVLIIGYLLGGLCRGLIVGCLVIAIFSILGSIKIYSILLMLFVVLVSGALFALAGFLNAMYAERFDDIAIIPTFVILPLTYFGGVFYSVAILPELWQKLTYMNPIFYIINSFRYAMLGSADISFTSSVLTILALVFLLYFVAYKLVKQGIGLKQ